MLVLMSALSLWLPLFLAGADAMGDATAVVNAGVDVVALAFVCCCVGAAFDAGDEAVSINVAAVLRSLLNGIYGNATE